MPAGDRTFISTTTRNQIIAGVRDLRGCLMLWVLDWVSAYETRPGPRWSLTCP